MFDFTFSIACSNCPSDTFLFFALKEKLISLPFPMEITFHSIDVLNKKALEKHLSVVKVSSSHFFNLKDFYELLPIGNTLGVNTGPKLVSLDHLTQDYLKKVAHPGTTTTAYYLLSKFFKSKEVLELKYDTIIEAIKNHTISSGVIIHEARESLKEENLVEIADLGKLWFQETSLPLPLGALIIKKSLPKKIKEQLLETLYSSLNYAVQNRKKALEFISNHSKTKNLKNIGLFLKTYLTSESKSLSKKGTLAFSRLLNTDITPYLYDSPDHFCRSY